MAEDKKLREEDMRKIEAMMAYALVVELYQKEEISPKEYHYLKMCYADKHNRKNFN